MRIEVVGGGPGGLYAAALLKAADPKREVIVRERNRPDDTFGFGVVFSDATLGNIAAADPTVYAAITADMARWDDIEVHYRGESLRSTGHGFAGLSRKRLLTLLLTRCRDLGVTVHHEAPVDDPEALDADLVIAADGLNSAIRTRFADAFGPEIALGKNRFTWLGTTQRFPAFTFDFVEDPHGLWRLHAYDFEGGLSTFIVETTEGAWRAAGMETATEDETAAFCARLFAARLDGHPLLTNHSIWRRFPTVRNRRWHHGRYVLLGDAAHTAHFSVGSGTKLAMEDGITLAAVLDRALPLASALALYEAERRPAVQSTQRAAEVSLRWFEETERHVATLPPRQFAFSLLTRSLRITHNNLALRDPAFVDATDRWFAATAGVDVAPDEEPPPPMFTPFTLRGLTLPNRVVVSPMCQYSATDGLVDDWHVVHYGSRAVGGAGLVIAEMTDVSPEGRITHGCAGLWTDAQGAAWRRVVEFAHRHGNCAIGIQLAHAGRKGSAARPWEGDRPLPSNEGWPLIAASDVPFGPGWPAPRAMGEADLARVQDAFVAATKRADDAGFDLVELHAAHGYLLHGFLSPIANRRDDRYGGDLAGRMRYPLEVFEAMRAVWPAHKPMAVRISATDWSGDGFGADDAVVFAKALAERGCDLIDVSTGGIAPHLRPAYGRLYQTPFAEKVRLEAAIPTITVGNISSYADVNSVLAAGRADLCAIARGHLFDPYWTRHAAFEQYVTDKRWPVQYRWAAGGGYTPRFEWTPRGQK
ncbi:MAG: bifunctional salicylyl-CoA 5-hydroxylase/oxidoreductase [Myxococcales bacterium]|nr:bifunctional salicylyl-CoA 5-hydroxylase/oxidoreductase [Myxococcales bacterium]